MAIRNQAYRQRKARKQKIRNKKRQLSDPVFAEKIRQKKRNRYHRLKHTVEYKRRKRQQQLRLKFGLTETDYETLFLMQGGVCAICGRLSDASGRRLAVDHDHDTRAVRNLLCVSCNAGLGLFGDSSAFLMKAFAYLKSWGK